MTDDEMNKLLDLPIPDLAEKLPSLSDDELKAVHDAENADGRDTRAGAMAAIHKEQEMRKPQYSQRDLDERVATATANMFTQADIDNAVKDAEARIMAEKPESARSRKARKFKLPRGGSPKRVKKAVEDGRVQIVFTDDQDVELTDLMPLKFRGDQFKADRSHMALNEAINFPPSTPKATVAKAWLLDDDGKEVDYRRFIVPLDIGAGRTAQIPAGDLMFG